MHDLHHALRMNSKRPWLDARAFFWPADLFRRKMARRKTSGMHRIISAPLLPLLSNL